MRYQDDPEVLPNGNTLITGTTKIVEVAPDGEVVWQFILKGTIFKREGAALWNFIRLKGINFLISEKWCKALRQSR